MKTYPNLSAKLYASPLMLREPERQSFETALQAHMTNPAPVMYSGVGEPGKPIDGWIRVEKDWEATKQQLRVESVYKKYGNVAVVKVHGVIDKMLTQFEMDCYGGCDLADVDKALGLAAADGSVDTVVLSFHSPGGSVTGTPETAARVASLRKTKEVHAFVETMCCSAAYYIASQADQITAAPSAVVGSIGVYMAILDQSRALEMEGLKVELIKAGRLKAMGASFKSLTDEERDILQAEVDGIHKDFKKAVRTLRDVEDSTMQGQWFNGIRGKALKLVDQLSNANLDEYVSGLIG